MILFTVLHVEFNEPVSLDIFDNQKDAFDKAFDMAKEHASVRDWVTSTPVKEVLTNGDSQWLFLDTSKRSILVFQKDVSLNTSKDDGTIPMVITSLPAPATYPVLDDPKDPSLPAGWDWNNKPILMQDLFNDPSSIRDWWSLSQQKQLALTIARISKRPSYQYNSYNITLHQAGALQELKIALL